MAFWIADMVLQKVSPDGTVLTLYFCKGKEIPYPWQLIDESDQREK